MRFRFASESEPNTSVMEQTTIRLPTELLEELSEEADERGVSRSEHIREVLEERERIDELEQRVDELETELARVHREKRQVLEQREEHGELVAALQEERALEQRRAQAGVVTRAKWWLTGMPTDEND